MAAGDAGLGGGHEAVAVGVVLALGGVTSQAVALRRGLQPIRDIASPFVATYATASNAELRTMGAAGFEPRPLRGSGSGG